MSKPWLCHVNPVHELRQILFRLEAEHLSPAPDSLMPWAEIAVTPARVEEVCVSAIGHYFGS